MRTKNSIYNFLTGFLPFVVFVVLGFVRVRVWQDKMDENIYALNQLFFQLFAYLSIAEAGIGALIQKKYYGLLIDEDHDRICQYYTRSKRMLRHVCYGIFGAGLVLSFFLKFLANDNTLSQGYMQGVFLLFLIKSLVEYFLFSPRFLLTADQKLYKINLQSNGYKILESILETILIYIGVSYIFVLCLSIALRIGMNLHLNRIVFREYPWLHDAEPREGVKLTGTSHIIVYKIVSAIHENIGALLISAFLNPLSVIVYTNYKYITKYLTDFVYQIGVSVTASLGNLIHQTEDDRSFETFEMINTMFYFIASFLTLALYFCIDPFITVWVGEEKLIGEAALFCMLYVFFHGIARRPVFVLKDVCVLYKELQFWSIAEGILTIALTFLFLQLDLGVLGVMLAAALALLFAGVFPVPILVYKHVFHRFPFLDLGKYFINLIILVSIAFLSRFFPEGFAVSCISFGQWFFTALIAAVLILVVLTLLYLCLFKSFRRLLKTGFDTLISILKSKKSCE